ncbi:MAG: MerR family transcriptional regulator [Candidatus Binatia bacterium]
MTSRLFEKKIPATTLGMAEGDRGWLTIEDLSRRSGVTTRNIRAYQSRGLLPPPVTRSGHRAAHYTAEHLARLRLVSRLQERGFSLAGIADLLDAWAEGRSVEQILGIESAALESSADASRLVTERELRALLPKAADPLETVKRLVALGLVERRERRFRIRYPRLLELGVAAVNAGVPEQALFDEFVRLRSDLHDIALRFVALFAQHVLQPFIDAGSPAERLGDIIEQMKLLRSLAFEATAALMGQAIADEADVLARGALSPKKGKRFIFPRS